MQKDISESELLFLPQAMFFTRQFARPDGLSDSDLKAYALTLLESVSPFSEELLKWGYVENKSRGECIVYGACTDRLLALRRTVSYMDVAEHCLPFCAMLFALNLPNGVNVFKRQERNSKNEFVAVNVENGKWKDVFAVQFSNDLDDESALKKLSELFEIGETPKLYECSFSKNLFGAITVSAKSGIDVLTAKCVGKKFFENADVRDLSLVTKANSEALKNRLCAVSIYAAFAVIALLAVWNISFAFQKAKLSSLKKEYEVLESESKSVAKIRDDALFINSLLSKKMNNTMMLARLNKNRPQGVLFLKSTATSPTTMEIRGNAQSVSQINSFERALNSSGDFKSVKFKTSGVSSAGAVWTLNVEFKK